MKTAIAVTEFEDLTYAAQQDFKAYMVRCADVHYTKGDCGCTWVEEDGWKQVNSCCDVCLFYEVDCGCKSFEDVEAILFRGWFERLTWQARKKAVWSAK